MLQKKSIPAAMLSRSTSTINTWAIVPFLLQEIDPKYNLNWKGFSGHSKVSLIISRRSLRHVNWQTLERKPILTISEV
jgi:hypothetical protein